MIMNRIRIIGIFILTLAVIAPEAALADWQVYFTGQAQRMFGAGGRGSFSTRSQCEAYRSSSPAFERNNSYCSGFDTPSYTPPAPSDPSGDSGAAARERERQRQLQLQRAQEEAEKRAREEREQELARQKEFQEGKKQLLGTLKGVGGGGTLSLKSGDPAALALKGSSPEMAVASAAWTPGHCQVAQRRVVAYRDALRQTVEVAERFNRIIATDQGLRAEWEKTMTAATERAKSRGQFLWLALPLGKLERLNGVAADGLNKNGADLADLLAGATDRTKREQIRIARQYLAEEKEVVKKLGKSYANINDALTLGGNAPLMLEDPDKSPTSPFKGDGMKLREALDMLSGLLVKRANAPWAKYVTGGFCTAFAAEAAARAMFDSWYDAFDAGLAWEQLYNMDLNPDRYLQAVQKLGVEMRKRSDRLNRAEKEFAAECSKQQSPPPPPAQAVSGRYKEVDELLIAKGADINSKDKDGNTPLHMAVFGGKKEVAELLIAKGADINAKDKNGNTPLHTAVFGDKKEMAELLIAKGASINAKDKFGKTPLQAAVSSGSKEIEELLRKHGAK